jgi:glycosyltransferase involved in cell wall biosynthesis
MRILVVSPVLPHLPSRDAARLAPAHLVAQLSERHAVGVVAATAAGDTPAARAWLAARVTWLATPLAGRWRQPISGRPGEGLVALATAVRRARVELEPDVVHLDGARLAPLAREAGAPSVLACLDERVEPGWARRWFGGADACVTGSEDDRRTLAAHVPFERVEIIPPGVDATRHAFRRAGEAARIVFTGDFETAGDAQAARRLARAILPLVRRRVPRAELLLASTGSAGAVRELARLEGVRVEGQLGDLRPSVWSAAVYASPTCAGSSRTARLLEAFALGAPVVATAPSASGLDGLLPGHHCLAAESDGAFADAVALLLREPVVANTIARNARELVERRFTWPAIAERYEALYARLASMPVERAA